MRDSVREAQQVRAEKALQSFLSDTKKFSQVLCTNYESLRHNRGCQTLVPDGTGAWIVADTDLHSLTIYLPRLTADQYLVLKYARKSKEVEAILAEMRQKVLDGWKRVTWIAGGFSNQFMVSGII